MDAKNKMVQKMVILNNVRKNKLHQDKSSKKKIMIKHKKIKINYYYKKKLYKKGIFGN
jgi:hypothetical protein